MRASQMNITSRRPEANARIEEYLRGRRDGVRWAISWLHARASEMGDPHAKTILNTRAFELGVEAKACGYGDRLPPDDKGNSGLRV